MQLTACQLIDLMICFIVCNCLLLRVGVHVNVLMTSSGYGKCRHVLDELRRIKVVDRNNRVIWYCLIFSFDSNNSPSSYCFFDLSSSLYSTGRGHRHVTVCGRNSHLRGQTWPHDFRVWTAAEVSHFLCQQFFSNKYKVILNLNLCRCFMEYQVMAEFFRILTISRNSRIEAPLLQYLSIMIQNIESDHAICKNSSFLTNMFYCISKYVFSLITPSSPSLMNCGHFIWNCSC